ncbi:MAG: MFS transporter [Myxococcota bacterium]|nr:MFS transporter [Myxococcota bacterium]
MAATAWWREPTRDQWTAFGAAWAGWVLDAFDFTIFLLVMPSIAQEFGVTYSSTALSVTLTLLMRLLGGLVAGSLADRFGRRLPLMLSIVWFALCDGAVALAPSFTWVVVLRTLFGFGMGAEWTAGATLAMESWPARTRGLASGVLQGSWAIGYLVAGYVAAWVVPLYGWRPLFALAALPALLVIPIRAFVKDPPRTTPSRPAVPLATLLGSARLRLRIGWAAAVLALGFAGYYGLTALYPTLLQTRLGLDAHGVANLVAWFNLGMMAGGIASGALASRRSAALAIGLFAFLTVPALPLYLGMVPLGLGLGAFLAGLTGAGHSGVTPYLLHSLFPEEVRARCTGLAYHLGAFAAAFVPFGVAALSQRIPMENAILWMVAISELLLVALLLSTRRWMKAAAIA